MKKFVLVVLIAGISSAGVADIQAPPASWDGPVRKLSRALANIVYGFNEVPSSWSRTLDREGSTTAASFGLVKGLEKTAIRFGYGVYELFTFPAPTYKQGYAEPYYKLDDIYPYLGYSEFPPELGFISEADYNRRQRY